MNCCKPVPNDKPKTTHKPIYTGCGSATDMANHLNLLMSKPTEVVTEKGEKVQIYHF